MIFIYLFMELYSHAYRFAYVILIAAEIFHITIQRRYVRIKWLKVILIVVDFGVKIIHNESKSQASDG